MIRWKALAAGCATVLVLGLLVQLVFIFLVVGYNAAARNWPLLAPWGRPLAYISGTLVYFGVMAAAGYVTAQLARHHILLHTLVVGSLVTGVSLLSSLGGGKLTLMSLGFFLSGIAFTVTGGLAWRRHSR
jgi:hypothetical protein